MKSINVILLFMAVGIIMVVSIIMGMISIAASSNNTPFEISLPAEKSAKAQNLESFLQVYNIGVASILYNDGNNLKDSVTDLSAKEELLPALTGSLVMVNVKNSLNVRSEPSEDAELAGKLYKDCGGDIIERKDGWTKLASGKLIGWAKDEYLLFDKEAKDLASDVGTTVAVVEAQTLRVRKEPSSDAKIWGLLAQNEEVMVDDEAVEGKAWVAVDFEGSKGYLSAEFVHIKFSVDFGETIEAIKRREEEEKIAKMALTKKYAANVAVSASDIELLAALIQCEAGNQPAEGQLAVGAVVMNRVRSGAYPNTIYGVIFASGQFGPASNGRLAKVLEQGAKQSCRAAAQLAIDGNSNIGSLTHFRRKGNKVGVEIGSHVFY